MEYKKRKVGAPPGGRVHWLLLNLPGEFKMKYELSYDYKKHNYVFCRHAGRKLYDVFIIMQTSRHYWTVSYVNCETQKYDHFGYRATRVIAEWMMKKYEERREVKNEKADKKRG